jgi:TatD DNase family protein
VIDTHAHLDGCEGPVEDVVARAADAGVSRILTVGRDQAIDLAGRFDGVRAVVGWHPHEAAEAEVEALRPLLSHPQVVALGECGLDYYRDNAPRDAQRTVFAEQIALANETRLPLVIHTREAADDTFAMLADAEVDVVLHCFSTPERLDDAVDRGWYCSFAGNVTYPSAEALREAARRVPADRILAETDAPYLAPVPMRGRRNEPANVMHTLRLLAGERSVEPDELESQVERNADRVFRLR